MVPRGLTRAGLSCSVLLRAEEPAGTKEEEEGAKDTYARVHTHTHTHTHSEVQEPTHTHGTLI